MELNMMKKWISLLLALCLLAFALPAAAETAEHPVIRITVQDFGGIYAELYPDTAPITVENFLSLVDRGFYNGLTMRSLGTTISFDVLLSRRTASRG